MKKPKKILFITGANINYGPRKLSALLKKAGHFVSMLIPGEFEGHFDGFEKKTKLEIIKLCSEFDLIGFSVVTNDFFKFADLTKAIKSKLDIPVVWGGIHPTVRPGESLEFADIVCVGEGEEAVLELAEKLDRDFSSLQGIKNIYYKEAGQIIENPIGPLEENLDKYPHPDYSLERQYVIKGSFVCRMTEEDLKRYVFWNSKLESVPTYHTVTGRGCPFNCAFCGNSALRDIYKNHGRYVRFRSIDNIIDEIKNITARYNFIKYIRFQEDIFTARSAGEMEEFAEKYKQQVGLPFDIHVNPKFVREEIIKNLSGAGLCGVFMGIQTGSYAFNRDIYERDITNEKVLEAARIINKYCSHKYRPLYDIIFDDKFQKVEDVLATVKLLYKLPKPYWINHFSLVLYPGTKLYERIKRETKIDDKVQYKQHVFGPLKAMSNYTWLIYRRFYLFLPEKLLTNRLFIKIVESKAINIIFVPVRVFFDVFYQYLFRELLLKTKLVKFIARFLVK